LFFPLFCTFNFVIFICFFAAFIFFFAVYCDRPRGFIIVFVDFLAQTFVDTNGGAPWKSTCPLGAGALD